MPKAKNMSPFQFILSVSHVKKLAVCGGGYIRLGRMTILLDLIPLAAAARAQLGLALAALEVAAA